MAFMGMVFAGVFLVIIVVVAGIYLTIGLVLFIVGLVGFVRDKSNEKRYNEWALAQPAPVAPYKKKISPKVLLIIGAGMWAAFVLFISYIIISSKVSYDESQANRNLFECVCDCDYEAAAERLEAGACIDSAGNTNSDSFVPAPPGEDTILFSLCNRDVYMEDEETLGRIEFLLENGADANYRVYSEEKNAPSHRGSYNKNGFVQTDRCGTTPLMAAAASGRIETMKLLIKYGADVNAVTYSGKNALMFAAVSFKGDKSGEAVKLLIEEGIDVHARDNFGQNVWDYVNWSDLDSVRTALKENAEWSSSDFAPPQ